MVTFDTFKTDISVGMLQGVNLPEHGINDLFLISTIEVTDVGNKLNYRVTLILGEELGGWVNFFKKLSDQQTYVIRENEILIKGLMEQHRCIQEERIRSLETGQAEMWVYIKQIREDIQEIKSALSNLRQGFNIRADDGVRIWQPIVVELIKLAGLSVTILGAIVGAVKILGK